MQQMGRVPRIRIVSIPEKKLVKWENILYGKCED
jgi:hypothetical protein